MAEKHTVHERFQLYSKGWRRGAGMLAIPDNVKDDSDFNEGYTEGRQAFNEAMQLKRWQLQLPPPSLLRTQEANDASP